jgi:type II secretory pathway pseudopilin PulG
MKKRQKAFTLIEVLVAITILIVGIISGFVLVTRALYNVAVIKDRLTASFLAQEGIELTRQIRDSNFLRILNEESADWRDGLGAGSYTIESKAGSGQSVSLVFYNEPMDIPNFFYDDDGLKTYNYSTGELTTFNREIKITTISDDEIRVESIMRWKTRTIDFDLIVEDHLYNWMKL